MSTIYTRATKGSALTWTEGDANITNLNTDKIEAVVDDLTPQLAGDLDVQVNEITTTFTDGDIVLRPNGAGIVVAVSDLEVGYGTSRAAITSSGNYALDLVTNGGTNSGTISINPGVNANIELTPNGTGKISLDGLLWPNADGVANYVLKTDGAGVLSWVAQTAAFNPATPGAIGGTTPSTGAFTDLSSTGTLTFKNPIEAIFDLGTTGGTIAPNPANGSVQKITLNAALTINAFTNPTAGESLTLIIYGGTAYTSITSTMKFAGGIKTLTGTAGCIDILSIYFDGTTYFASLGKGFA